MQKTSGPLTTPATSASNVVGGDIIVVDDKHSLPAHVDSNKLSGRLTCRDNVPDPGSVGSEIAPSR